MFTIRDRRQSTYKTGIVKYRGNLRRVGKAPCAYKRQQLLDISNVRSTQAWARTQHASLNTLANCAALAGSLKPVMASLLTFTPSILYPHP